MATTNQQSIPELESQIKDVKSQIKNVPNFYGNSNNAISDETTFDKLQGRMEDLENRRLISKWYGNEEKGVREGPESLGLIGGALDFISKPLYGVVGATKHFAGQGKGSLYSDVVENMADDKNTFGDVLSNAGMNRGVAAPLGFALDIFFDPVNWATMGSSAFIPKVGVGAYRGFKTGKGVIKGASLATKAGLLEKTTTVGRFTPFLRKSNAFAKFGEKSMKATADFQKFSGRTVEDMLMNTGRKGSFRQSYELLAKRTIEQNPKAGQLINHFVYDPIDWVKRARVKDIMQRSLGHETDLKGALRAAEKGESIEPFIAREKEVFIEKTKSMPAKKTFDLSNKIDPPTGLPTSKETDKFINSLDNELREKVIKTSANAVRDADDAVSLANNTKGSYSTLDGVENADRLINDAVDLVNQKIGGERLSLEDINRIVTSGSMDNSGVKWFDNMMEGIKKYTVNLDRVGIEKTVNVGKKTMESYDKAMAVFRVSKVAASPTSWVNAVVGNMIMTHMAGGSIGPKFIKRLEQARQVYYSKNAEGRVILDHLLIKAGGTDDSLRKFLIENKTGAHGTFGDLSYLGDASTGKKGLSEYVDKIVKKHAEDLGIPVEMVDEKQIKAAIAEIEMHAELQKSQISKRAKMEIEDLVGPNKSNAAYTRDIIRKKGIENVSDLERGTGLISNELYNSRAAMEVFDFVAKKAKDSPDNYAYKVLNSIFNKAPEGYEKIDQTFKMATFVTATTDGYTMGELRRLAKFVDINPEEINAIKTAGQLRYTLHPRTAMELANVMYLNYAAMPAAVKIMRNMPLLGSPFISFMYGMSLKTGQTLAYNPSAFNKAGFAMKEFGGTQSPLEKQVLETDKYSYLTQPGMMRLPFFKENPVYMNMASMIPYYSLNMFNPSSAKYGNSVRERLVSAVQQSPILKDPAGSLLFDYLIQPLILDEATRPQGQFGQALYPTDANFLEKMGYGARTFGEAFVPNVTAAAGLLTPEAAAEFIPSYRWRQLARAKAGKSVVGIKGKESKASRSLRAGLNYFGVPIQTPVNKTYVDYDKKK